MSCRYCGAELPLGALFCGSCGRTVAGDGAPRRLRTAPEPPVVEQAEAAAPACPQCGSAVAAQDVFCRECGFVVQSVRLGGSQDTVVVQPGDVPRLPGPPPPLQQEIPLPVQDGQRLVVPRPAGDPLPPAQGPAADRQARERFVLQFSTGESVIVAGSGLVGRNPAAQPGERIEQLVVVGDVGKSVSKTHLEFGQESGEFWVSDRWSTNGTVLRVPGAAARRCEPGHRYRVPRGTRIEIGDQFFVVS